MNKEELKLKYEQMSNDDLMNIINNKTDYTDEALEIVRMIMQKRGKAIITDNEDLIEQQDLIPNDYPMTEFFSRSLNIIAVLYALLGAISAGFAMYNQQVIEGYEDSTSSTNSSTSSTNGSTTSSTTGSTSTDTSTSSTNGSTSSTNGSTTATTTSTNGSTTATAANPNVNQQYSQMIDADVKNKEISLIKNLRTEILQLKAQGKYKKAQSKIQAMITTINNCKSNPNNTLLQCNIVDSNGNLIGPFAPDPSPNTMSTENYNVSSSTLPLTGQNSSSVITQANDRFTNEEMMMPLSDNSPTQYNRSNLTNIDVIGSNSQTTESFSTIY